MSDCSCNCHASGGTFKLACTVDHGSSGVPGLKSCSPCSATPAFHACGWKHPRQWEDRVQARCIYPGCKDDKPTNDGCTPPKWTFNGVCRDCRRRYKNLLQWIVEDYHTIKQPMEIPARVGGDGSKHMSPKSRSYGHPAERASDAVRLIVDRFNAFEDDLREHRRDRLREHQSVEVYRLARSYGYLVRNFNEACTFPLARDWAEILVDMHAKTRSALGLTRFSQKLPVPCPSCDVAALVRSVGHIDCGNCHRSIREDQYPFLTRMVIDDLIEAYDRQEAMA